MTNSARPIKVIINGANGRMGKEASYAISKVPNLQIVAELGREDNLAQAIRDCKAKAVLDLTNAQSAYINTKTIITSNATPIIGTSGLVEQEINELKSLANSHHVNGIIVPNFSVGAVLMMKFAQIASNFYKQVEIIERHHPDKLDAPSGTALRTAEIISKNLNNPTIHNNKSKETIKSALGANYNNIPIHSLRLSGSCAHQSVIFGGLNETLNITHDSMDRKSFMPGVVLACQKAPYLSGLQVGLETILDI